MIVKSARLLFLVIVICHQHVQRNIKPDIIENPSKFVSGTKCQALLFPPAGHHLLRNYDQSWQLKALLAYLYFSSYIHAEFLVENQVHKRIGDMIDEIHICIIHVKLKVVNAHYHWHKRENEKQSNNEEHVQSSLVPSVLLNIACNIR